jgi:hypothetical protein
VNLGEPAASDRLMVRAWIHRRSAVTPMRVAWACGILPFRSCPSGKRTTSSSGYTEVSVGSAIASQDSECS